MGLFLLYWGGEDVRGAPLRASTAIPMAECEDIADRSLLTRPFKLRSKGKSHKNLRGARMKTIDVVAAVIEKDGEILAHIENVDWLPAAIKVVDALEKRGEL